MNDKDPWPKSKNSITNILMQKSQVSDNEIDQIANLMGESDESNDLPIGVSVNAPKCKAEIIDMSAEAVVDRLLDQGYEVLNPMGTDF